MVQEISKLRKGIKKLFKKSSASEGLEGFQRVCWNLQSYYVYPLWISQFIGPLAVAGRSYKIGSLHPAGLPSFFPSVLPSVLSRHFLGIVSLVFSDIWHSARNPCEVVRDRARFSRKCFENWGNGPKMGQKQGSFNLLENLVINFYRIWSVMKIYIFAVFLHKSHIWENFCSWDMGQNVLS